MLDPSLSHQARWSALLAAVLACGGQKTSSDEPGGTPSSGGASVSVPMTGGTTMTKSASGGSSSVVSMGGKSTSNGGSSSVVSMGGKSTSNGGSSSVVSTGGTTVTSAASTTDPCAALAADYAALAQRVQDCNPAFSSLQCRALHAIGLACACEVVVNLEQHADDVKQLDDIAHAWRQLSCGAEVQCGQCARVSPVTTGGGCSLEGICISVVDP